MPSWHAQGQFYPDITLPESVHLKSVSHNRTNTPWLLHYACTPKPGFRFCPTSMVTDIHTSTACTYICIYV